MSTFARRTYLRLLDDRSYQLPQSANFASRTQPRPRGTLIADQRRACAARPKGKYSRGRMALAPIRARRIFPATGHARSQLFRLPTSFNQLSRRNAAFFGTFLGSKKVPYPPRPLPVLRPSFYLRGLAKYDIMLQGIPFRLFWGGFGAGRLRPAARSDRWITWWKVCGRAAKTPVTAGLFSPLLGESAFGDNVDNRFWGGQNRPFWGEVPQ